MLLLESFTLLLALALPCFQSAGWCSALWGLRDGTDFHFILGFLLSCGRPFRFLYCLSLHPDTLLWQPFSFYLSTILLNFWKYIRTCVVFHTLQFPPRSSFLSKQKHTITEKACTPRSFASPCSPPVLKAVLIPSVCLISSEPWACVFVIASVWNVFS